MATPPAAPSGRYGVATCSSRWITYWPGASRSPVGFSCDGNAGGTAVVLATLASDAGVTSSIWVVGPASNNVPASRAAIAYADLMLVGPEKSASNRPCCSHWSCDDFGGTAWRSLTDVYSKSADAGSARAAANAGEVR